jgi:hypothetical protein
LAETPLMLSIMVLAYKDRKVDRLVNSGNIEEERKHLFDRYISQMLERSTRIVDSALPQQQTLHHLSWLARTMIQHNMITYQIESMQPSWLENVLERRLYSIFSALFPSLAAG